MSEHVETPAAPQPPHMPVAPAPAPKKGFAITALVLGIVAIVGCWIPILNVGSILIGVVGLVFGIIAIFQAVKGKAAGKVMAIVGTSLSAAAILFAFVVNAATAKVIDEAVDEISESSSITTSTEDDAADESADDAADDSGASDEEPADEPAEPAVGTFDNPAVAGDGTVWTVESSGDAWEITLDSIELVPSYDGDQQLAIIYGTATPTVISDGATSSWVSFPRFEWIADGAVVDEDFTLADDSATDGYRSTSELEATAGTTMEFYETVGLPDGVVPDLVAMEILFSWDDDDTVYFSTGLE